MKTKEFITRVLNLGEFISETHAGNVAEAVLKTFGRRISYKEMQDLASQLPKEIAEMLNTTERREDWTVEEFVRQVARAEGGVPVDTAGEHARIVLGVLQQAASTEEIEDILSELPGEYIAFLQESELRAKSGGLR